MPRFTKPRADAFDTSGNPRAGAKLYFYVTGTTTPLDTYSNDALSVVNANPVVADSAGLFGEIFLGSGTYKVVLKTSADVTVWTADPVAATPTTASLSPTITAAVDAALAALNPVSTITANTTLAVPGSYATVNAAMDYLNTKWISPDATVTIDVASGTVTSTSPVAFSHPCGDRIKITGATSLARTISAQTSVSGSAGAYSVTLTLDSVASVSVGNYLLTYTTVGTGDHYAHRGVWKITAVDVANTRVTVLNTSWAAAFPTNTITSSSSVVLRSVLAFTSCDGLIVAGAVLGELSNVVIAGNADSYWNSALISTTELGTHGLYVGGPTVAVNGKADNVNSLGVSGGHVSCGPYVGVSNFDQQGVLTEMGGSVWGDFVASCSNRRRGFYASTASGIRAKHISACGNFLDGALCDLGGSIYTTSVSCASGNGLAGFVATQSGFLAADTGIASGNLGDGFKATSGATLQATTAIALNNGVNGFFAEYGSTLYCNASSSTGNTENGLSLAFNSTARANGMTCSTNTLYGMRATEYSYATITGPTSAGNGSGDRFLRNGAMLLDSSTVYAADQTIGALTVGAITGSGDWLTTGSVRGASGRFINGANYMDISISGIGDATFNMSGSSRVVLKADGVTYPTTDLGPTIGRSTNRWLVGYFQDVNTSAVRLRKLWTVDIDSTNAVNVSSDARNKTNIVDEPLGLDFINALRPVQYKLIDSGDGRPGVRPHHGLLAQELKATLDGLGIDHAAFTDNPITDEDGNPTGETRMGIRYSELISSLIKSVQELSARVAALES